VTVAALYVDPTGPYADMPGVDPWDASRDARLYRGPHPVVAHPPCGPWGRYAWKSQEDRELARIALRQVQQYGGVLEHPADSKLWRDRGLPAPGTSRSIDTSIGVLFECTIAVRQIDWGHRAEKPTWLYIVGTTDLPPLPPSVAPPAAPKPYRSGRQPRGVLETLSKRQRRLTPPAFARWLVDLASTCRR